MTNSKACSRCKKVKGFEHYHLDKNRPSGVRPDCKECRLNRSKFLYHNDGASKKTNKNNSLKKQFGINLTDYENMWRKQDGKCLICAEQSKEIDKKYGKIRDLVVDHCHKTNKIRGLLCGPCNRALGGFRDDVTILKNAIKYLNLNNGYEA